MALDAVVRVAVYPLVMIVHARIAVTGGASPLRCIAARMAFGADTIGPMMIHREGVIERRITPVAGVVALAALPRKVIGRAIAKVTRLTIGQAGVIHGHRSPVGGASMAGAALGRKVIGRCVAGMARSAIGQASVIHRSLIPITGIVAQTALPREVIRWFVGRMAGNTIGLAGVIEVGIAPTTGIVASAALPRKVISGFVAGVA